MGRPKISFGIIVLNGEPFTRFVLRALYPFAHQILVVEGACPGAKNISTPEGHSIDGTLEVLNEFKISEDPDNKLEIITREGFWSEKTEQSQAYAKRITGDYLWQIDIDEFYTNQTIEKAIDMLEADPSINGMDFPYHTFWGGLDYLADSTGLPKYTHGILRIFKWGKGYTYSSHRPPVILDENGISVRNGKWIDHRQAAKRNMYLFHYSLLFPKQVQEKCDYRQHSDWDTWQSEHITWAKDCYFSLKHPFRVYNLDKFVSWLDRYKGEHPEQVIRMMKAIEKKEIDTELRRTDDIDELLARPSYIVLKFFVKCFHHIKSTLLVKLSDVKYRLLPGAEKKFHV